LSVFVQKNRYSFYFDKKPNDANNEEQQKQHQEREQRIGSQYHTKVFACDAKDSLPTANALQRIIAQFKVSLLARYFFVSE
jgi:hypothetical protein